MKKLMISMVLLSCNDSHDEPVKRIVKISADSKPEKVLNTLPSMCEYACQIVEVSDRLYFCFQTFGPFFQVDDYIGESTLYCETRR